MFVFLPVIELLAIGVGAYNRLNRAAAEVIPALRRQSSRHTNIPGGKIGGIKPRRAGGPVTPRSLDVMLNSKPGRGAAERDAVRNATDTHG